MPDGMTRSSCQTLEVLSSPSRWQWRCCPCRADGPPQNARRTPDTGTPWTTRCTCPERSEENNR